MGAKRSLRAVAADETAPTKPKTITQAADGGTARELLVAMRARIAETVENPNTPPRDLAALSRRLLEIAREIEAIDVREAEEADESGATPDDEWEAV